MFEINEAFAAQSLAAINPMGGAIALGHPLGATGTIRTATVIHALQRHPLKYGMVTRCVGMSRAPQVFLKGYGVRKEAFWSNDSGQTRARLL